MIDQETVLERLKRLSTGERAALRRAAGQPLAAADGRALQALFRALPGGTPPYEQGRWFTTLSIACLWDAEEAKVDESLPRMLQAYAKAHQSNGMDSRIRSLLDARREEDGYLAGKLARLARMLRAENRQRMPDMDRLLKGLKGWNGDRRSVQLRWADEYYLSKEEVTPNVN